MPEILRIKGFIFFFFSNESNEPMHIHIEKTGAYGKIWIEPKVQIAYLYGFTPKQRKEILQILEFNKEKIKNKWNEYFRK